MSLSHHVALPTLVLLTGVWWRGARGGRGKDVGSLTAASPRRDEVVAVAETALDRTTITILGKVLRFSLQLQPDQIEPLFSGGAWAGSHVWLASVTLCNYLMRDDRRRAVVDDRVVLELGGGVGLPSFCASLLGAKRVFLTEQAPLDEMLMMNVKANGEAYPKTRTKEGRGRGGITVKRFNWKDPYRGEEILDGGGEDDDDDFDEPYPHVVLISDCIYEGLYGESWRLLARVLNEIRRSKERRTSPPLSTSPPKITVLNCLERRNKDGVDRFLAHCKETYAIEWRLILDDPHANEGGAHVQLYECEL